MIHFDRLFILTFFILLITTNCYAKEIGQNRRISEILLFDDVLSGCIENAARRNGWELSDDVISIECPGIVSENGLDGFYTFRKIQNINFSGGKIKDLSPLNGLVSIESAILSSNAISDLGALSGLTNLRTLNLGNNEISDISPLSGLDRIEVLELYSNNISDISALAGLKDLKVLSLYDNKIKDISVLYGLKKLVFLDLEGNKDLNAYQISELKKHLPGINLRIPFQVMDQLSEERVNYVFKKKPINAPVLSERFVPDFHMRKLLQNYDRYTNLEDKNKADIRSKDIRDFEGLDVLSGLTDLKIMFTRLENTYALRGLAKLQTVKLTNNHIASLEGLSRLENLTSIDCSENEIKDITPLKYMYNLKRLSLTNNQISDISILARIKQLRRLYLGRNRITDIRPLLELPNLEFVSLESNERIRCSDLEMLKKQMPGTKIYCPDNCAKQSIEEVRAKFIRDLESLKIHYKGGIANEECYAEDNGQLYRTTYTNGIKSREPIDVLSDLPGSQKKVYFFTEIIGAKGRTITHQWYYNDTHMADVKFLINGDRWRTWSSKNIGVNNSGVWQVKVVADDGCLIGHESIRIAKDIKILDNISGGFLKSEDAITLLIRKGDTHSTLKFCYGDTIERRSADGDTPLLEAINAGKTEIVKGLLKKGANIYARDLSGKSALDLARITNISELNEIIHKALKRSPPWAVSRAAVTTQIENNEPQNCVISGVGSSVKEVQFFTELMDMKGRTIVHRWMVNNEHMFSSTFVIKKDIEQCFSSLKIDKSFIDKHIRVMIIDGEGKQLFDTKFKVYDDNDRKARPGAINRSEIDNSAIYRLFKAAGPLPQIAYLIEKAKKTKDWTIKANREYFLKAIINSRSITHLRYYLNQSSNIDCRKALNMALEAGYDSMALYIIKRCLTIDRSDPGRMLRLGKNPILMAVINNNRFMVRYLLHIGEDPNYTYRRNANALTRAIMTENIDIRIIHDLLAYGANPNTTISDSKDVTALMLAAKRCDLEIVKLLLAYGADPFLENRKGINAIDFLNNCPDSQQREVMIDFIKGNSQ